MTNEPPRWRVVVPERTVGVVYHRYGRDPRDTHEIKTYGSMGTQAAVLPPNTRRWLNPVFQRVRYAPQTYVPDGTIGLVCARAGQVRPPGRRLGQYVKDTNYFQDGDAFLRNGGEQGWQLGHLPGGAHYSINPELFEVITVDTPELLARHRLSADDLRETVIPVGNTGVVVTLDGQSAGQGIDDLGRIVEGHHSFQLPWVFLGRGGQRGVQQETLSAGTYTINPLFARVVQIPTRELTLEWTKRSDDKPDNFDTALEQIVLNVQGYRLSLEMSQILTIPSSVAPRLVRRFGEGDVTSTSTNRREPVQRFVGRVLGATVAGYFIEIVGKYQVMEFIINFGTVRAQLQDKVLNALDGWGVEAGGTILEKFTSEDRELDDLRRMLAGQDVALRKEIRQREFIQAAKANRELQAEIDRIDIALKGERDVVVLREQIGLLGPYHVALERLFERMSAIKGPQYVSGNGDMAERLLSMMPLAQAQDMLKSIVQNYGKDDDAMPPIKAEAEVADPQTDPDNVPDNVPDTGPVTDDDAPE